MAILDTDDLVRLPLPRVGLARAAFSPTETTASLLQALEDRGAEEGFRVVAIRYGRLPPLPSLIGDVMMRLADLALALWPSWCEDGSRSGTSDPWLKAAVAACAQGRRPLPKGFTASVSSRRLAGAIDSAPLLFALASDDPTPPRGALLALARAAEWLAREASARVLIVVPESLATSTELDSVGFEATHVRLKEPPASEAVTLNAPRVRVSPLIGQPNPSSGGEKLLAERLERDPELAGLFRFNMPVYTALGSRFLVDLVWEAGKVVVEVDGYYFHSGVQAFSADRRRDYELTVSGYLVLRLPENEVTSDVALAVEKIRDVAALRRPLASPVDERTPRCPTPI